MVFSTFILYNHHQTYFILTLIVYTAYRSNTYSLQQMFNVKNNLYSHLLDI